MTITQQYKNTTCLPHHTAPRYILIIPVYRQQAYIRIQHDKKNHNMLHAIHVILIAPATLNTQHHKHIPEFREKKKIYYTIYSIQTQTKSIK